MESSTDGRAREMITYLFSLFYIHIRTPRRVISTRAASAATIVSITQRNGVAAEMDSLQLLFDSTMLYGASLADDGERRLAERLKRAHA